ncbi:MAG: DUF2914 domain-containing protein [Acidobacteria bacterium]|nr:DUF2914 domain-containing protein [Acidobacteriota bacterium]
MTSAPAAPGRIGAASLATLARALAPAQAYLPAAAFFGGFLWDAATIGRRITPLDLWFLCGYYVLAGTLLVLVGRGARFRFSGHLNLGLQFFFGGLLSALSIFYFTSAAHWPAYLFVIGLVCLLVANEYLEKRYRDLTLSWTLFALCGAMLFNFVLPHLFRSVSRWWFYPSTLLGLAAVFVVRRLSARGGSVRPAVTAAGVLVLLHLLNWIPPVPLVNKDMVICRDVIKDGAVVRGEVERGWNPWKRSEGRVHQRPGEKIYCVTSVFLPAGLECRTYHQWSHREGGRWVDSTRVPVVIRGGRTEGFRAWSYKQNLAPGRWRVTAETEGGAVIGRASFRVEHVPAETPLRFRTVHVK